MKRAIESGGGATAPPQGLSSEKLKRKKKKMQKKATAAAALTAPLPAASAASAVDDSTFVPPRCAVPELLGPHHLHRTERSLRAGESRSGGGGGGGGGGSGGGGSGGRGQPAREDSDEWQTCKESWADIAPLLSQYKKKRVWMPFYYDGECAKHLRDVGFKSVYHKKRDFFALAKDPSFLAQVDVVIDNPPYTGEEMKANVLRALRAMNKPFAVLLPLTVLHSKLLRDVLDTKHVQAIIPRRVMVRKSEADSGGGGGGSGGSGGGGKAGMAAPAVPFKYLVWLCYRMGIKGGLQFV